MEKNVESKKISGPSRRCPRQQCRWRKQSHACDSDAAMSFGDYLTPSCDDTVMFVMRWPLNSKIAHKQTIQTSGHILKQVSLQILSQLDLTKQIGQAYDLIPMQHDEYHIANTNDSLNAKCRISRPSDEIHPVSMQFATNSFQPMHLGTAVHMNHFPTKNVHCKINSQQHEWSLFIAPKFWCVDREGCRREIHGRHFNVCIAKCSVHEIRTKFEYIHMTCSACIWENYYPLRISHETV